MANQTLLSYITSQRETGVTDAAIKDALLAKGWQQSDIDAAFMDTAHQTLMGVPVLESSAALPNAWQILLEAIRACKQNWQVLLRLAALPLLGVLILFASGGAAIFKEMTEAQWKQFMDTLSLAGGIGIIVGIIAIIVLSLFAHSGMYVVLRDIDTPHTFSSAFHAGKKYIGKYIWTSIVTGIMLLIGFVLLIIPGIVFFVWYALATPIVFVENLNGWKALQRSKALVQGRWWRVFGRLLALIVIGWLVAFIASLLSIIPAIGFIINLGIQLIVTPVLLGYTYLLYIHLRNTR
jgi:hypothetical protein